MSDLVERLKNQTKSLKDQYVEKTKDWAKEQVVRNIDRRDRYRKLVTREASLKRNPDLILVSNTEFNKESKWFWNSPSWNFNKEEFVKRMEKHAIEHYNNSIEKLALRIEKKGLNKDKIKMKTSHIGVNIETTLTDGEKTVNAWTIIASGVIQRPHYRYLIK